MSEEGIHQLHIFIFVLAVFHVLYCVLTLALGNAKVCVNSLIKSRFYYLLLFVFFNDFFFFF